MSDARRVDPVATYRLQLTPAFGFSAAADLLDHIERLGISHVYLSPIAQAVPGSSHGYDVVDHTRVRAEFGGEAGFEHLLDETAKRSMALVVDHVPNHVAAARPELNAPWWQLLREGRGSPGDDWFDVDWDAGGDRVILPWLGDPIDETIAAGHLTIEGEELVVYGDRRLPLAVGTAGLPIAALVDRQHYRLQHWRRPERNVRRFFTIDDLIAVRVENPAVAAVVDTIPARYATHPGFGGVRVDHVDGLADPEGYLRALRGRIGQDALLYVEKIVAPGEWLPETWPVDGTTGYEFIRGVDHVVLPVDAEAVVTEQWTAHAGDARPFHRWEQQARLEVVEEALAPDLARLTRSAAAALGVEVDEVADEVRRLVIELPRYRTYLPPSTEPADDEATDLVNTVSRGPVAQAILEPRSPAQVDLRIRWQQLTGPVMAKGAEDRAFYRYLRLASLSEVGGDPGAFAADVADVHDDAERRRRDRPRAMLASSTHDTKRSEDVRAWSGALAWRLTDPAWAERWSALVDRCAADGAVDAIAASLAAQTVATTPGLDADRLVAYLVKALREAAVHTTWEDPDERYESALVGLAGRAIEFVAAVADELAPGGRSLTLVATALRLTCPGVPDVYQGTEGFSHRLVDPDNRVPPDWSVLAAQAADGRSVAELWAAGDAAVKPVLVRTLLELRRRRPSSLGVVGPYAALAGAAGVIAYVRGDVVVVVRRGLASVHGTIELPPGAWSNVLEPDASAWSGVVSAARLVGPEGANGLPVAVLERTP